MKGCMATGIFPRTRKEGAAMAEISMSAMKDEDGMVIGKVGGAIEAVHREDVHDTMSRMTMTVGGEEKKEDGMELQKDIPKPQTEDGRAAVGVVAVMMTIMITMMIITIQ